MGERSEHESSGNQSDRDPVGLSKTQRKQRVLTKGRASITESISEAVVIKHDDLFFLSAHNGEVPLSGNHGFGLYFHDCRYLRGYTVRLSGQELEPLVVNAMEGWRAAHQLTNRDIHLDDGTLIQKEELGVSWTREFVRDEDNADGVPVLRDVFSVRNYGLQQLELPLTLSFRAEFDDVYEVRGLLREEPGTIRQPHWHDNAFHQQYDGADGITRRLCIRCTPTPDSTSNTDARFLLQLDPRGSAEIHIDLAVSEDATSDDAGSANQDGRPHLPSPDHTEHPDWLHFDSTVQSDNPFLNRIMAQSIRDLEMLENMLDDRVYLAAGIPWFVTLFGRDSLTAALQSLVFAPGLAESTLRLLAKYQGHQVDHWRDEQPGKILHELRVGELARLREIPQTPYYGSVDATLLFLILFGVHADWTGRLELFHDLRDAIELALSWIDEYGDSDGDGFVDYKSASGSGLVNQGWKDSGDAIVTADGHLAKPPIALVEVQGYAYRAKRTIAGLFERAGEPDRAIRLRDEADSLRVRFNEKYWMDDRDFFALALQEGDRQAAVVSSNPGQALWTGIVAPERAGAIAERLLAPDMFSGWGIRTLSTNERAYNPLGYHLGTVWPHDNAIIGAGLRRYGFDAEFGRIYAGILHAASHFDGGRLPELFAGQSREEFDIPVHYPVACHPQAWAAGSIPMFLVTALGLHANAFDQQLHVRKPMLPPDTHELEFHKITVGEATVDLRFRRGKDDGITVDVLRLEGSLGVVTE